MPDRAVLESDVILELPEFDRPPKSPFRLLAAWLDHARYLRVREPLAFTLATVDRDFDVSTRTVLMKALDDRGIVFTTHQGSRKGRALAEVPRASATFYWRETLQQVTVAGPVERLPDDEADTLFHERPHAARATTAASQQSQAFGTDDSEDALRQRARLFTTAGLPIGRPEGWGGYRIVVERAEFWHGSPDRLHRRLQFTREGDGAWTAERLQP